MDELAMVCGLCLLPYHDRCAHEAALFLRNCILLTWPLSMRNLTSPLSSSLEMAACAPCVQHGGARPSGRQLLVATAA